MVQDNSVWDITNRTIILCIKIEIAIENISYQSNGMEKIALKVIVILTTRIHYLTDHIRIMVELWPEH